MELEPLPYVLDGLKMRKRSKITAYAYGYSGMKQVQAEIDEEGCGAPFCAARLVQVERDEDED